ncbi:hypothetical protein K9M41_01460 [Candidatus Gracilibacteria bacterium]|nr:hypothetical protein [Candidatus Gracilibacteria bacterium]
MNSLNKLGEKTFWDELIPEELLENVIKQIKKTLSENHVIIDIIDFVKEQIGIVIDGNESEITTEVTGQIETKLNRFKNGIIGRLLKQAYDGKNISNEITPTERLLLLQHHEKLIQEINSPNKIETERTDQINRQMEGLDSILSISSQLATLWTPKDGLLDKDLHNGKHFTFLKKIESLLQNIDLDSNERKISARATIYEPHSTEEDAYKWPNLELQQIRDLIRKLLDKINEIKKCSFFREKKSKELVHQFESSFLFALSSLCKRLDQVSRFHLEQKNKKTKKL